MEAKELSLKTHEELVALERDLRGKIRDARFSLSTGQNKMVRATRDDKRDLARVLSAITSNVASNATPKTV